MNERGAKGLIRPVDKYGEINEYLNMTVLCNVYVTIHTEDTSNGSVGNHQGMTFDHTSNQQTKLSGATKQKGHCHLYFR